MSYYIVKTGADRFDLRQARFRSAFEAGQEHPHDLCAVGFTREGMKDLVQKYSFEVENIEALEPLTQQVNMDDSTVDRNSEEWFINNLIGLAAAEKQLFLSGKRDRIDVESLVRFIREYRPDALTSA